MASHKDTRALFLNANVPLFLYPFLNTTSKTRPFEYLRLTSLGVIGALVKVSPQAMFFGGIGATYGRKIIVIIIKLPEEF